MITTDSGGSAGGSSSGPHGFLDSTPIIPEDSSMSYRSSESTFGLFSVEHVSFGSGESSLASDCRHYECAS